MRGSTEAERDELKTATFVGVRALGPNGGEAVTRCDKTTLSNYHAQHMERSFMPIDVVRDIEAALGRPVISEVLVRQAGFKCVPIEDGTRPAQELCGVLQAVSDAEAKLRLGFRAFASDGLDAADRRSLRFLLDALKADISEFEKGL